MPTAAMLVIGNEILSGKVVDTNSPYLAKELRDLGVDLERILLRDKSVVGKNTPQVRKAFENYDLTFLAHASVEKNLSLTDHWLEQVGVSTHSLMSTRVGRR